MISSVLRPPSQVGRKQLTDELVQLDVMRLPLRSNRNPLTYFSIRWPGSLTPYIGLFSRSDNRLRILPNRKSGDLSSQTFKIQLTTTECNFGGKRFWFICPNTSCRRRCRILYFKVCFRCRVCLNLSYPSQNETVHERLMRRAEKVRKRLGWKPGILNDNGVKPKYMHLSTFEKLLSDLDDRVMATIFEIGKLLKNTPS